jgi:hypothetical protein
MFPASIDGVSSDSMLGISRQFIGSIVPGSFGDIGLPDAIKPYHNVAEIIVRWISPGPVD